MTFPRVDFSVSVRWTSVVLLAVALLLLAIRPALAAEETPAKPNVLFIAVDDLRPELGCYGLKEIQSPNLDALARRGVLFNRAYCQQALCNPSRASLLTGCRPDSIKIWDLVTPLRTTVPDIVTLPQQFKDNGYQAVGMGKIYHNTFPDPKSWSIPEPHPKGHQLYSAEALKLLKARQDEARKRGEKEDVIRGRYRGLATEAEDVPDNRRFDGALADLAIDNLRELSKQNKPFFLGVGFILPHLPWTPPKKYWDLYDPEKLSLAANPFLPKGAPAMAMFGMYELRAYMDFADTKEPPEVLTEAQQRRLKHGYYASVSFIDAQIGRLLEELNKLRLSDNTIVILWGDHGWKLGEHASWCKQTNYEVDARVPLILRVPGARANGKSCNALVEFIDIYPTLCELCHVPLPRHLEGKSMAPLLEEPTQPWKVAAFSQFPRRHEGGQYMGYAMRTDRYRYVEWRNRQTGEPVARELYDHENDPQENTNIAEQPQNKELIGSLNSQLRKSLPQPPVNGNPRKSEKAPPAPSSLTSAGAQACPGILYPEDD